MDNQKDLLKGIYSSTFFHLLLLLFSLWFTIPLKEEKREYVDLTWTSLPSRAVIQPLPMETPKTSTRNEVRPQEPTTPVELPKLKSQKELETLPLSRKEKPHPEEETLPTSTSPRTEEKESITFEEEEKKVMKGTEEEKKEPSYFLEGAPAERMILSKVIPKYPPGLQKEALIQVKLTVDPGGQVTSLIPLQKGDPILEEITMKALAQWKFAPLPLDVPQIPQEGQITFIYRLQ